MEEIIRGKINAELHRDIEGAFGGSQNVYAILSDEKWVFEDYPPFVRRVREELVFSDDEGK